MQVDNTTGLSDLRSLGNAEKSSASPTSDLAVVATTNLYLLRPPFGQDGLLLNSLRMAILHCLKCLCFIDGFFLLKS